LNDGTFISGSSDNTIKLWNKDKTTPERTYEGHTGPLWALAVLDDKTFISGSEDRTIKLWKIGKTTALRTYKGHTNIVCALAVLEPHSFISASADKTIKLWSYLEDPLEDDIKMYLNKTFTVGPSHNIQSYLPNLFAHKVQKITGGKRRNKKSKKKRSNKKKYRKTRRKSRK